MPKQNAQSIDREQSPAEEDGSELSIDRNRGNPARVLFEHARDVRASLRRTLTSMRTSDDFRETELLQEKSSHLIASQAELVGRAGLLSEEDIKLLSGFGITAKNDTEALHSLIADEVIRGENPLLVGLRDEQHELQILKTRLREDAVEAITVRLEDAILTAEAISQLPYRKRKKAAASLLAQLRNELFRNPDIIGTDADYTVFTEIEQQHHYLTDLYEYFRRYRALLPEDEAFFSQAGVFPTPASVITPSPFDEKLAL